MKYSLMKCRIIPVIFFILLPGLLIRSLAQSQDHFLVIHLRGVYSSKITLLALTDNKLFKPFIEVPVVNNGETTKITIPKDHLPGEFVIRFDYKEKESSTPYPSEKSIFINDQDLELRVSPVYCNNADSTSFQPGEKENAAFVRFSKENAARKEKLGLLQNFLMNYDDPDSKFFIQGITEYEQRREAYNQWLKTMEQQDKAFFVSNLYCFQFVPAVTWKGSESDRIRNMISHYFDGMNFNSPMIIKTSELNKWMDNYVNLYGQQASSMVLRDSLFSLAGKTAIEKAKEGNPLVYGWMVDYFYRGYETNGITSGMKILEPYMNDPNCLTSKKQEIARRLKGIETLVAGSKAPAIEMTGADGSPFVLSNVETSCKYILVLFWSAGCSHCAELVEKLYPWQQQQDIRKKTDVVAISLDETGTEKATWEKKIPDLKGWKHLRADEGIRSKVAADYFVLATPVMVLIDAGTREIVAVPDTFDELTAAVH